MASVPLVAALGMSFGAAEAQAHTGDLTGVAVCQADGSYKAPVKLTTANVPAGNSGSTMWKLGTPSFQGTPTSAAGMDRGPVASVGNTTVTLGTLTFPGTTTGSPWVYAYTSWTPDGFARGSDNQITGMDGTCIPDNPGPRTVIGTVQKGTASCTTHEVEQFRVDTVIPQVWSATAKAYIDDPDKSHWTTVRVDLPSRPMTADEVKACPVPDVKQCVTTVGFPTDAVVYADVHTAADSPVDNVITSGPFTVNTQISVSVPTTNYKFTVIRIVAKDGTVLKTQQVTSTTACNTVIPDNPGPRTVIGTVQKGTASCTTHEVEQFRVDTVIPQVWSATAKAYIDDPDKSHWTTVRVDLPSRPMTADEVKACPVDVPPNPGPKTVVGNWQKIEGSGDCVTTYSVWEQQGTWSVPQIWSNGAYVNDPNTAHWTLVKVDKRSRPMTVAELKACPTSSDSDRGIDATPGLEGAAHNWVAILTPSGIVLLVGLLAIWTTLVLRRRRQPMEEEI
ncbi:hypothetical protein [Candidatus Saccharimonas aalborgensis]|uniref:hypothetical protein n=1 Tax=Candidatus Saccharimonas aalborgensis TaxID=1332188 RepID=UPI0010080807|nr:hypothetical protein [Candidatus Saccharimonas aalborgensis]